MSRQIDLSQELTDEDRQYLVDRGRFQDLAVNQAILDGTEYSDSMLTAGQPLTGDELPDNTGVATRPDRELRIGDAPAIPSGEDDEDDDSPDYLSWTKAQLEAEVHNRDLDAPSGAKKADLAAILEEHDASGDEADEDDEEQD